ncbi:MAG: class D sortase [Firmicutes bacterium]|nr:class D sortase [Bacillota bacterium]
MKIKAIKNTVGVLLIAAGIGCMAYALYAKYSVEQKKDELVAQYEDYINWVNDNDLDVEQIEQSMSEQPVPETVDEQGLKAMQIPAGILGIMEIEKIDLVVTLAEGTDNKSITLSVGHFPGTAMPGQVGNFAVVGHRSYRYGAYFNRLDELENGDIVRIKTADGIFSYMVDSKMIVEPNDTWVLEPSEAATMTLVTCTPIRTATHRLIIKGHLLEE